MSDKRRIIRKDNYDREGPGCDEEFVGPPVPAVEAAYIAGIFNRHSDYLGSDYYDVVPVTHKLRRFEP